MPLLRKFLAPALLWGLGTLAAAAEPDAGILPVGADGKPLNFDFETGTLKDWKVEGDAFVGQPIKGDVVRTRRGDMKSGHAGDFWIGGFEKLGDEPIGTLTSVPFVVTKPYAGFLLAGGQAPTSRVEIVSADDGKVIHRIAGDETEELKRVAVDLTPYKGKKVFVQLVDEYPGGWGHVNFDDFRLYDVRPNVPARQSVPGPADSYRHAGLSPEEAARAMTVPPGFQVSLFAGEPDVVQPIAFAIDERGRLWVAEAYSYPIPVAPEKAKDRILIFEDTDGDGKFEKRKVFADKLNLVSGLEVGFGGAWVGAAPNLLFLPDKDGDDRADGPPQVVLDGWGRQDTHETLNSFAWGPDGWLYGCHGVFTHSLVGKPSAAEKDRTPINAGIWRYHPTKGIFEVFAHGTSNPWGFDFDRQGRLVEEACVIPHLYYMIQGGRCERQAGQHFNPYTYDDIKTIADHRHYLGANPHGGNGRSDSAGGGHAHSGFLIYQADAWPKEYRGSAFMNNIHGARLNRDLLIPKGSGLVGSHAPDFLMANDAWSQVVSIRQGPDGAAYMIDWYDKNQCHRSEVNLHDRTNGRVFKITYGASKPFKQDLKAMTSEELAALQASSDEWLVRASRRLLQERKPDPAARKALTELAFGHADEGVRLRGLWALHAHGGLEPEQVEKGLADGGPFVRAWTIQLATEAGIPSDAVLARFAAMAKGDDSQVVRLYLASAAQRIPVEARWEIVAGLVSHSEDADDHNLPLMYWYAAEPLAVADAARAAKLAEESAIPQIQSFMTRRIGAIGSDEAITMLVTELGRLKRPAQKLQVLTAINEALRGRRTVAMPKNWSDVYAKLQAEKDPQVRSQATALGVTFGDVSALDAMRETLADARAGVEVRRDALASLLKARDPKLPSELRGLIADSSLRSQAIRGLAAYDDPKTPEAILSAYQSLDPATRREALATLAARVAFAKALLAALEAKTVPRTDLTADLVRQLRTHKDKDVDALIAKTWGTARDTSADKVKLIADTKARLTRGYADRPDVNLGRALFVKTCAQCHTLFGTGAKVGPELTGSNRADLEYILSNILDPSALIGKDYLAHTIATSDGRVLTGLIRGEDKDAITLITATETLTIPKPDIEERKESDRSMMPDDLTANLSEHELRSLVVYLAQPGQVPALATAENAATFFNGKDLTGWVGDPELWKV